MDGCDLNLKNEKYKILDIQIKTKSVSNGKYVIHSSCPLSDQGDTL